VTITDLNTFGLAMLTDEPIDMSSEIDVTVELGDERITLTGTAVRVHNREDGTTAVGLAFAPLPASTTDALARWCFRHPFGPDLVLSPASDRTLAQAA